MLDADRVLALLRRLGVIQTQHARLCIRVATLDHQRQPPGSQLAGVPGAIHQELSELLQGRLGQHLRHPLGVLAGQFRDSPSK
jgi:hypothetical protein